MTKCLRSALLLFTLLLAAGCAQYQLVNAGDQVAMGDAFVLRPQRVWNRIDHGSVEVWTVNGPLLEQITVYKGIKDGQDLLITRDGISDKQDFPTFQKHMTALEIRDLLEATLARTLEVNVRMADMKPWKFADVDGFRFDYAYAAKSGLNKRGFAVGAIENDKLYMIVFSAAELHYYDTYADDLERLIASVGRKA